MHAEIAQAVEFLGRLLNSRLENNDISVFKESLSKLLHEHFAGHWDLQKPDRGNAYRAITNFNGQPDSVLTHAAINASLSPVTILSHIPRDFVLWIDPFSVSYRVGDHGNIMTLFDARANKPSYTVETGISKLKDETFAMSKLIPRYESKRQLGQSPSKIELPQARQQHKPMITAN